MQDLSKFKFQIGDSVITTYGKGFLININPYIVKWNFVSTPLEIQKSDIIGLNYFYQSSTGKVINVLDINYVYAKNIIKKHGITKDTENRCQAIIWWIVNGNKSKFKHKLK